MRTVKGKKLNSEKCLKLKHYSNKNFYTIFAIEGPPQIKCIKKRREKYLPLSDFPGIWDHPKVITVVIVHLYSERKNRV